MGTLAPKPAPSKTELRQQIDDRLRYWSAHLAERNAGKSHPVLTRDEIIKALDVNLDELLDLEPKLKLCHLPADTTVWRCDWCNTDICGTDPTICTCPRHNSPTGGTRAA